MTSITAPADRPAQQQRKLIVRGAVAVALLTTTTAYYAMVGFSVDVLAVPLLISYALAGVYELSLMLVALMAREDYLNDRPAGTKLTTTWILAVGSGIFAGWHELYIGHSIGAAIFRFSVPLLAVLMWHFALIGDKHLAAGRSWTQLRTAGRLAAMFRATRRAERAYYAHQLRPGYLSRRRAERAQARQDRAEDRVLDMVPPDLVRAAVTEWRSAVVDVSTATTDVRLNEARRLLELSAPRKLAPAEPVAATPAAIALPAAVETPTQTPAAAPAPIHPAESPKDVTEATTEPTEPISTPARPHLVTVPNEPAEEKVQQTAPEPAAPPTSSSTDTSSTNTTKIQAIALRKEGKKVKEISQRLGVAERTVYRWTNPKKQAS